METQQKSRVDVVLEVGAVTETVEVAAAGAVLETENSAVGQVIENKRVADLPVSGRNLIHLAAMVPGVQYGSRSGGADGQGGFPIPGGGMSVISNGQREVHQSITLDGVESIMPLYNISTFTPSIDAVEEFKVQTGSYSAEFGQSSGARVEVSMKSVERQLTAVSLACHGQINADAVASYTETHASVDGAAIKDFADLTISVYGRKAGEKVRVQYEHSGAKKTAEVTLQKRADDQ